MPARERLDGLAVTEAQLSSVFGASLLIPGPEAPSAWDEASHTYLDVELFALRSLLLLDGGEEEARSQGGLVAALAETLGATPVDSAEFTAAATGGGGASGLDLLAVAVAGSRNALLLRGSGPATATGGPLQQAGPASPLLRVLPWHAGARSRVSSLAFTPPGGSDRLLVAVAGGGVYCVEAGDALRPTHPAAARPVTQLAASGPVLVALAWWRRSADGAEVAVAVSASGEVRMWWDGQAGTPLCTACVTACSRLLGAMLVEGHDSQYLLLWGEARAEPPQAGPRVAAADSPASGKPSAASAGIAGGGVAAPAPAAWTLLLEREEKGPAAAGEDGERHSCWESLPQAPGRPAFAPTPLVARFGCAPPGCWPPQEPAELSLQAGAGAEGRGALVARYERRTGLLQLFDPLFDRHPLAEHALPPGAAALRVTPRLVFVLHPRVRERGAGAPAEGYRGWVLSAVARHAASWAGATAAGESASSSTAPAAAPLVLQEVLLGPAFADSGRAGGLLLPSPARAAAAPAAAAAAASAPALLPPAHHAPPLAGCLVWAPLAVAHAQPARAPPEAHFCALLGARRYVAEAHGMAYDPIDDVADADAGGDHDGDRKAELLGTALALDVLWLYKRAARDCVSAGNLRRARCLFQLAGADPADVVGACLAEGRAEEALAELAEMRGGDPAATRRLRLACLAHMQLSAWAAAAAAAALHAAPPAAAAAAAAAARAVAGTVHMVTPSAAAAAAAAVAEALQEGSPDVTEEEAARVAVAAASACSAAAAAAAIATGLHDNLLRDDSSARGEGGEGGASASEAPDAEAMLRLMLACGRAAEALHGQGVALAEGGHGAWLSATQRAQVGAASPSAEEALLVRPGSAHAAACATMGVSPCVSALGLLSDEGLLRAVALASHTGGATPGDPEAHLAALLTLARRAPHAGGRPAPVQRALEAALGRHWGGYPAWRAAAAACATGNAAACGVVYGLAGDAERAVLCRLAALDARWVGRGAPQAERVGRGGALCAADEEDLEELAGLLSALQPHPAAGAAAAHHLVAYWQRRGFPQARLEAFLLERAAGAPATLDALAALLPAAAAPCGASSSGAIGAAAPVRLSARFALKLAALRVTSANAAHAAKHPLSPAALWEQVSRNLTRHAASPAAVRFAWPQSEADGEEQPRVADSGHLEELVAFTCGHACSAQHLEEILLPRLSARMRSLRRSGDAHGPDVLQLSAEMVEQEFGMARMALACPACVEAEVVAMAGR